jgi:hypothetical protein
MEVEDPEDFCGMLIERLAKCPYAWGKWGVIIPFNVWEHLVHQPYIEYRREDGAYVVPFETQAYAEQARLIIYDCLL